MEVVYHGNKLYTKFSLKPGICVKLGKNLFKEPVVTSAVRGKSHMETSIMKVPDGHILTAPLTQDNLKISQGEVLIELDLSCNSYQNDYPSEDRKFFHTKKWISIFTKPTTPALLCVLEMKIFNGKIETLQSKFMLGPSLSISMILDDIQKPVQSFIYIDLTKLRGFYEGNYIVPARVFEGVYMNKNANSFTKEFPFWTATRPLCQNVIINIKESALEKFEGLKQVSFQIHISSPLQGEKNKERIAKIEKLLENTYECVLRLSLNDGKNYICDRYCIEGDLCLCHFDSSLSGTFISY